MATLIALTQINFTKGPPMKQDEPTTGELEQRIELLEAQQTGLVEVLKLLLPIAISIPSATRDSAEAVKALRAALTAAEETSPRSEDFWYLASAMALLLSSKAAAQHPNDPEVLAIHQGIRAHRMQ